MLCSWCCLVSIYQQAPQQSDRLLRRLLTNVVEPVDKCCSACCGAYTVQHTLGLHNFTQVHACSDPHGGWACTRVSQQVLNYRQQLMTAGKLPGLYCPLLFWVNHLDVQSAADCRFCVASSRPSSCLLTHQQHQCRLAWISSMPIDRCPVSRYKALLSVWQSLVVCSSKVPVLEAPGVT